MSSEQLLEIGYTTATGLQRLLSFKYNCQLAVHNNSKPENKQR